MPFQDQHGKIALPKLTPDGAVPTSDQSDGQPDLEGLIRLLILEFRMLRQGMIEAGTCEEINPEEVADVEI